MGRTAVWPGEVAVALGWPLPSASRQPWDSAGYSSPDGPVGREVGPLGPCRHACGPSPVWEPGEFPGLPRS